MQRRVLRWSAIALLVGCTAPGVDSDIGGGDDPFKGTTAALTMEGERWALPEQTRMAGMAQSGQYDSAPAWEEGRNCTGTFLPGTDALGRHVMATFPIVRRVGGYNCRQNTANREQTSVHGTG